MRLVTLVSLALAACLALTPTACADQSFTPEDAADLEALFTKGDVKAADRIAQRFDVLIDELITLLPAPPDEAEKPKREKGKASPKKSKPGRDGEHGDESGFKDHSDLESRITSAAVAWRLALLADKRSVAELEPVWKGFVAAPRFAQALAFAYLPKADKAPKLLEVAAGILGESTKLADENAELAAAICVVYDRPSTPQMVNENLAPALAPDLVWHYFVNNAGKMRFGVRIAPELLVYVVDLHARPDDVVWALATFTGVPRVGSLYPKVPYDYEVLHGKPKKSDKAGWNLPNIYRFGGICADQAYFTATVAKALGIPATYTVGENSDSAHAWVGFVQSSGKKTYWDSEGRYDSYRGITGFVSDPQTGHREPDAIMPMLVQWGLEPLKDRVRACTMRTVDERLQERTQPSKRAKAKDAPENSIDPADTARARSAILRAGLRGAPTDARTWLRVRELAKSGAMDDRDRAVWFDDVSTLCGANYPEMVLEVTSPMIASIKETAAQHAAWSKLANFLARRADLAGQALISDGKMWEKAGESEKAGQAYESLLKAYPDGGPYVERALAAAARILMARRDGSRLLALYDATFKRMKAPEELPGLFGRDSTWYAVGKDYVKLLRDAGRSGDANTLDARIERVVQIAGDAGS